MGSSSTGGHWSHNLCVEDSQGLTGGLFSTVLTHNSKMHTYGTA